MYLKALFIVCLMCDVLHMGDICWWNIGFLWTVLYIFNISRGYIDVRRILNSDIILVILVDCVLCYSY